MTATDNNGYLVHEIEVGGVPATVNVRPLRGRHWNSRGRYVERADRSACYVGEEGESVLENFALRTSRPVDVYRQYAKLAVERFAGGRDIRVRWDRHCGCSMCPCSPGFKFVRVDGKRTIAQTLTAEGFVDTANWPSHLDRYGLDVTIGARVTPVTPEALDRVAQLGAQLEMEASV